MVRWVGSGGASERQVGVNDHVPGTGKKKIYLTIQTDDEQTSIRARAPHSIAPDLFLVIPPHHPSHQLIKPLLHLSFRERSLLFRTRLRTCFGVLGADEGGVPREIGVGPGGFALEQVVGLALRGGTGCHGLGVGRLGG